LCEQNNGLSLSLPPLSDYYLHRDELTENGKVLPPHSIIMKSKNFTEVYESVRKDTVSGKVGLEFEVRVLSILRFSDKVWQDLIRKLNENVTEPVPKPDAALVKQFKVAPTDKFLCVWKNDLLCLLTKIK